MTVGEYCNRNVVTIRGDESVQAAARLMREHHVGDLVVVEDRADGEAPVAVVTDRDLVVEVLAAELETEALAVRDIVTHPAYFVHEGDSLFDALEVMRGRSIRRLPVVAEDSTLVGIVTVDDIVGLLGEILEDLAAVVERQRDREQESRP
ncbi:MAG: CBS domain-containing protein [Arhodomonas sp.]|nr:CBS domain-containing protein [Arhodomonas sp.]